MYITNFDSPDSTRITLQGFPLGLVGTAAFQARATAFRNIDGTKMAIVKSTLGFSSSYDERPSRSPHARPVQRVQLMRTVTPSASAGVPFHSPTTRCPDRVIGCQRE